MNDDDRIHDDEIVSAVLDGEATAAEQQLVASDPELSRRLETFRALSQAVAEPVQPLDDLGRRRLIERALDYADPPPVALAARRARRRIGVGGAAAVASAAVVAALALAGGNALLEGASEDDAASGPAADEVTVEMFTADDADGAGAPEGAMRLDALGGDAEVIWIGTHGTADDFADAAREAAARPGDLPAPTSTTPSSESRSDTATDRYGECAPEVLDEATASTSGPWVQVRGELDGRMLLALVAIDDPSLPVIAIDLSDCTTASLG